MRHSIAVFRGANQRFSLSRCASRKFSGVAVATYRSTHGPRAFLAADGACRVEFGTQYLVAVALLKDRVPRQGRRYDRRRRTWYIAAPHALAALRALRTVLPDAVIFTTAGPS